MATMKDEGRLAAIERVNVKKKARLKRKKALTKAKKNDKALYAILRKV